MRSILQPGLTCESIEPIDGAGLVVDAHDYYLTVYRALLGAERYVLITGWQFDSCVELVRGEDAEGLTTPTRMVELLQHIVQARPELRVYILAWDFSLVFALEREWLQRLKFDWMTNERIRYVFDGEHPAGASHHQKLVIVDGAIAFTGGIDLCESRWDHRSHPPHDSLRLDPDGQPQKPYHDVQGYVCGQAVRALEGLFRTRWKRATGEALQLAEPIEKSVEVVGALPVPCGRVGLSVTFGAHAASQTPHVEQIRALYERAIDAAERLIYIETQYFTSRAVLRALCARLEHKARSKLAVVMVMPEDGDTPKEKFALGEQQAWALASLARCAREHDHTLRILTSVSHDAEGVAIPTFIHSKILVVDDHLLVVGSANCTNRSMSLDSELCFAWECERKERTPLADSIAKVRANLLAEHAGLPSDAELIPIDGLIARLDALVGASKLRLRSVAESPSDISPSPLLERAFDPDRALTDFELDDLWQPVRPAS